MSLAILRWTAFVTILCVSITGCSYFQGTATDDDVDLSEIEDGGKAAPLERGNSEIAEVLPPAVGELELKLKAGDRFPLSKTVEHRLTQTDKDGTRVSTSRTNMVLSLVVDDVFADGRKQMTVRYHRVQYEQDIRGKRIAFSSDNTTESVPTEALLYAGLANNGFSFWIGPNNKIASVVDFGDFLRRCLRNVPEQYKNSVQQQLEATKGEDGIANFIDDSIGLLPYSGDPSHPAVAVKEGSAWELEPRRTESPIPMMVTTRCILKELSSNSAEILLTGRISGSPNPVTMRNADGDIKILVKGGHCTGSCRVDRQTGLPTQSQVQRYLELAMELPDGQRIQQNKDTMSTITAFLDQSQKATANSDTRVQQTNFQNAIGGESRRRVVPAGSLSRDRD